jgi:choline dehydrogenase-like flavoprotein
MTELQPGLTEAQTLERDLELTADVCIVGSGAGGAVAADVLTDAGLKVLVVEEGGYFTRERFRMREEECYPHLYQESAQRTSKDLSVAIYQGRAVGGTTVVNWTTCFRTPDETVERWRQHHGVGEVDSAALRPWFERAEARLNIRPIPLEDVNLNNRLLWDGCKALGFEVETLHRNTAGCIKSGYCGMGCPVDAKQSMLLTYLPDAMTKGGHGAEPLPGRPVRVRGEPGRGGSRAPCSTRPASHRPGSASECGRSTSSSRPAPSARRRF